MALVIRSWRADRSPDSEGNIVSIVGRQEGFVAWFLTLIGIDVTTTLRISDGVVYFEHGSLGGFNQRVIPTSNLSSAYFGYVKPWKEAVALTVLLLPVFGLGLLLGPLYYFLNKRLSIGVVEISGIGSGIEFKRSLIEGKSIDENEGRRVIAIIHDLITRSRNSEARRIAS